MRLARLGGKLVESKMCSKMSGSWLPPIQRKEWNWYAPLVMSAEEGGELKAPNVERDAHLAQLLLQHRRQQTGRLLGRSLHRDVEAHAVFGGVACVVEHLRAPLPDHADIASTSPS